MLAIIHLMLEKGVVPRGVTMLGSNWHRPCRVVDTGQLSGGLRPGLGWAGILDAHRRKFKPPSRHEQTLPPGGNSATSPIGYELAN